MNIGKSLKIALAQRELKQPWLATKLGLTRQQVSNIANTEHASGTTIDKVAKAFNMEASEFVALGEIDYEQK